MRSLPMTLVDALEVASSDPQHRVVTSEYLFNVRHCYLRFNSPSETITQVFYEESKGKVKEQTVFTDYEFVDATENNLTTTFCPTYTDLVTKRWYVFTLVRPDEKVA